MTAEVNQRVTTVAHIDVNASVQTNYSLNSLQLRIARLMAQVDTVQLRLSAARNCCTSRIIRVCPTQPNVVHLFDSQRSFLSFQPGHSQVNFNFNEVMWVFQRCIEQQMRSIPTQPEQASTPFGKHLRKTFFFLVKNIMLIVLSTQLLSWTNFTFFSFSVLYNNENHRCLMLPNALRLLSALQLRLPVPYARDKWSSLLHLDGRPLAVHRHCAGERSHSACGPASGRPSCQANSPTSGLHDLQ